MACAHGVLAVALWVGTIGMALASPQVLSYQGRLRDSGGNPVTTPVTITFSFHAAEADTAALSGFQDVDTLTPDAEGRYETQIGDLGTLPVPASVFSVPTTYLNVNVNGEDLMPRRLITPVGLALQADRAQTIVVQRPVAPTAAVQRGEFVWQIPNGLVRTGNGEQIDPLGWTAQWTEQINNNRVLFLLPTGSVYYTGLIEFSDVSQQVLTNVSSGIPVADWVGHPAPLTAARWLLPSIRANDHLLELRIGTNNGSDLVWGPPLTLSQVAMESLTGCIALTDGTFLLAYIQSGKHYVRKGTLSGNSVTLGAETETPGTSGAISRLSDTRALLVTFSGLSVQLCVVTVGADSATLGSPLYAPPGTLSFNWPNNAVSGTLQSLSSEQTLMTIRSAFFEYALVVDTSAGGLQIGPELRSPFDGFLQYTPAYGLVLTHAGTSSQGNLYDVRRLHITNGVLSLGEILYHNVLFASLVRTGETGVARLGNVEPSYGPQLQVIREAPGGFILGLALADGAPGDSIPIAVDGVATGLPGIQASATYYARRDGTLTTTTTEREIGVGLSSDELLLNIPR